MHWRVTSAIGMNIVVPSRFTIHSLNLKRFGRRHGHVEPAVLSLSALR